MSVTFAPHQATAHASPHSSRSPSPQLPHSKCITAHYLRFSSPHDHFTLRTDPLSLSRRFRSAKLKRSFTVTTPGKLYLPSLQHFLGRLTAVLCPARHNR